MQKGYSVAALRTNFYIRELGLMLDAGLSAPNMTINHMLITHPHSDHTANIPFHIYAYKEPDKNKNLRSKGNREAHQGLHRKCLYPLIPCVPRGRGYFSMITLRSSQ